MVRFIFITGGVVSSLGKGLAASAIGVLLQARGYKVNIRKLDPYLNVDTGTMSPYQHGEVFVTEDGVETDLDLGHYERFTGVPAQKSDSVTSGRIYLDVIARERLGGYDGGTVQVVPHVTDAIKSFILNNTEGKDFVLCEIGGTVGDIEGQPFLEAARQLYIELEPQQIIFVHLTLIPYISAAGEFKTKPTQHSVKEMRSIGIQPHILLCRVESEISPQVLRKIGLFCNVKEQAVIPAPDVNSIYEVPLRYHEKGLDQAILDAFGITETNVPDLSSWIDIATKINNPKGSVKIGVFGKYAEFADAYKSLSEALVHAGLANRVHVDISWIQVDTLEVENRDHILEGYDGIIVPGGFGVRGSEGKINAITYARTHKIPYFGICLGMQMACIEVARNLAGLSYQASSSEFRSCENPIIGLMDQWVKDHEVIDRKNVKDLGGTMRLGAYDCHVKKDSLTHQIYGSLEISERHRHRYEVNIAYREQFEAVGLKFVGLSPDGVLPEIVELEGHPWFIGVQFHPELKSRPFNPHPLFKSFIEAAIVQKKLIKSFDNK